MSALGGFPCSNCGAQLVVDGSTPAPTCGFCHTQTQLPSEVWAKYHPNPLPQIAVAPRPAPTPSKTSILPWVIGAIVIGALVLVPLVLAAVLGASSVSSIKTGRAKVGDACGGRTATCSKDKKAQLHCGKDDTLSVALTCKGPNGCQLSADGTTVSCDTKLADAKDPCEGDGAACSTDHKAELDCVAGKFAVKSTCKGADGCTIEGTTLTCDDHIADVGDPCFDTERTACSSDHKSLLGCVAQRFAVDRTCKGANGCSVRKVVGTKNSSIDCDETISEIGDPCEGASVACSGSGKELLSCQSGKLISDKKCPKGCVVTAMMPACR